MLGQDIIFLPGSLTVMFIYSIHFIKYFPPADNFPQTCSVSVNSWEETQTILPATPVAQGLINHWWRTETRLTVISPFAPCISSSNMLMSDFLAEESLKVCHWCNIEAAEYRDSSVSVSQPSSPDCGPTPSPKQTSPHCQCNILALPPLSTRHINIFVESKCELQEASSMIFFSSFPNLMLFFWP